MGSLQTMFDTDKRLAILPNIGPLVMPTTKAQYGQNAHPKPASLFSHNDQQNTWQALAPEGATRGWGGRMGDLLAVGQRQAGVHRRSRPRATRCGWPGRVDPAVPGQHATARSAWAPTATAASSARPMSARRCSASSRRHAARMCFERDMAAVAQRSIDAEMALRTALQAGRAIALFGTAPASGNYNANNDPKLQYDNPLTGAKSFNSLAQQLQIVARMIDASSAAGVRRGARCSSSASAASTRTTCRTATMPT